jgi:hypothetical protein
MSSRSPKLSLRKPRLDIMPDAQNGYPFGAQGKLTVQVQYSLALNAPTGKFELWVRADSQAPFVQARKLDNSPYEFLSIVGTDNQGQDIFEFDGCYAQWKVVYNRNAWVDPTPNDPSVLTNWVQIFWETK